MGQQQRKIQGTDGEHAYLVTQFGAEKGFALLLDLMEVVGGSFGQAMQGALGDKDHTTELLGKAAQVLAQQIRSAGGVVLFKRLFENLVRDKKKFHAGLISGEQTWAFNDTYAGNYGEMVRAITLVVEANYRSFFDGQLSNLTALLERMGSAPVPMAG